MRACAAVGVGMVDPCSLTLAKRRSVAGPVRGSVAGG